jgi:hypothetical protein
VQRSGTIPCDIVLQMANNFVRHIEDSCRNFGRDCGIDIWNELFWKMVDLKQLESFRHDTPKLNFLDLVSYFRRRESTVAHGRPYGFLGISAADWPRDFVSYHEDFIPTFERVTKVIIRYSQNLGILSHIIGPDQHIRRQIIELNRDMDITHSDAIYRLPSWVPDSNMNMKLQ